MPPSADVIRADFDRIARLSEGTPDPAADQSELAPVLEPVARRLLAAVPLRAQVLDIGCGTGVLARELATKRGAKVTAIDLAPRMIDVARLRTSQTLRVDYRVADIMALTPRGFDIAIAVNTLHHLPLAEIADRMATAVVPGGKVLIADLFSAHSVFDVPYNALSWLVTSRAGRNAHRAHDELSPFREIRSTLRDVLPGVVVRRHLGWRYTAVWTKP